MARKLPKKRGYLLLGATVLIAAISVLLVSIKVKGLDCGCYTTDFSGFFNENEKLAVFEGADFTVPKLATGDDQELSVLGSADAANRWIEIDLSDQRLYAWDGADLFLESPISTGLPWWPTPKGEYRIWIKLKYSKMEGGSGAYYYFLPNVPYVMYFENEETPSWRGYGLHGTYWHNDFGTPRSHGCVNLPTPVAGRLFYWTSPTANEGSWARLSTAASPGTKIVIHE